MTENAIRLMKARYCLVGETPEAVLERVSWALSMGDPQLRSWLVNSMTQGRFFPNSPALRSAGTKKGMLHACFILPIEDSVHSIFRTVTNMAVIFQRGGGVGINFSPLRSKDSPLSGGGRSSGAISFMDIFDTVTEVVKQGGFRRGALMGILNYTHPEITDFIRAKLTGRLTNFNLSVMVNDKFMEKVENGGKVTLTHGGKEHGSIKAKDILDLVGFSAWCCGDPGILFLDRINRDNRLYPGVVIDTTNPCSEVALPPYGACCLASLNLSHYMMKDAFLGEEFQADVSMAARVLKNMNYLSWYPLTEIAEAMREFEPIGVGVMGFADGLIKMGVKYDSDSCLEVISEIGKAYKMGTEAVAKECFYQRVIAPTGSLSILGDCSSGIEPVFSANVERTLSGDIGVLVEHKALYKSDYARFAHQISPEWHLKVQAKWQEQVDGGVSKTINLPNDASVDTIKSIYMQAWKLGVKGVTVFRDGCKEGTLKVVENKCEEGGVCHL